jgi:dTDP-4-dehydrorhamnose 3,5-epimerase
MLEVESLAIPDVKIIKPKRHGDARGFFSETYKASAFAAAGLPTTFVQDNHSFSAEAGVLRGLHFQVPPAAQGKLVRVSRGAVFDVAVDLRVDSLTYGQHVSTVLTSENWTQIWVPPGFAHGVLTLEPHTEVLYKVLGAEYVGACEGGLAWDDSDLAIPWPAKPKVLSERDTKWPSFAHFTSPFRICDEEGASHASAGQ